MVCRRVRRADPACAYHPGVGARQPAAAEDEALRREVPASGFHRVHDSPIVRSMSSSVTAVMPWPMRIDQLGRTSGKHGRLLSTIDHAALEST